MAKKSGYAVLGLGVFGTSVARALAEARQDVLVIDQDSVAVETLRPHVAEAVIGNVGSRELLRELRIADLRGAIVCVGENLEASILATLACKELGCSPVIARAVSDEHREILYRVGADRVLHPEHMMAVQLVQSLVNPAVLDRFVLGPGHSIVKCPLPASWIGRSLTELAVRSNHGVAVIAVERGRAEPSGGEGATEIHPNPAPDTPFLEGDRLVILGSDRDLERFQTLR
jgi:trk system potassium uptake protein TrkA